MSDEPGEIVIKDATLTGRIRSIAARNKQGIEGTVSHAIDALELTPEAIERLTEEQRNMIVSDHFRRIGLAISARMTPEQRKDRAKYAAMTRHARNLWSDRRAMLQSFDRLRNIAGPKEYLLACKKIGVAPHNFDNVTSEAYEAFNQLLAELGVKKEDVISG